MKTTTQILFNKLKKLYTTCNQNLKFKIKIFELLSKYKKINMLMEMYILNDRTPSFYTLFLDLFNARRISKNHRKIKSLLLINICNIL